MEAVSEFQPGKKFEPVPITAVKAALQDADSGKGSAKDLTDRTSVVVKETDKNVVFETRDRAGRGAWVHKSYLSK